MVILKRQLVFFAALTNKSTISVPSQLSLSSATDKMKTFVIKENLFTFFYVPYKKKVLESWKIWPPIFDGFTCSGITWTRFHLFFQNVCRFVSRYVCVRHKFCGSASAKTDRRHCMKFKILVASATDWMILRDFDVARIFWVLYCHGIGQNWG